MTRQERIDKSIELLEKDGNFHMIPHVPKAIDIGDMHNNYKSLYAICESLGILMSMGFSSGIESKETIKLMDLILKHKDAVSELVDEIESTAAVLNLLSDVEDGGN